MCCSDHDLSDKKGSLLAPFFIHATRLLDVDRDLLGNDRRIERHVVAIAQFKLQGVFARRERYFRLGLRTADAS